MEKIKVPVDSKVTERGVDPPPPPPAKQKSVRGVHSST